MRRPAKLERAGAMTPRDRIWAAVRSFEVGHNFSVAEIMLLSEQRADTVISYLDALSKARYVDVLAHSRPVGSPRRELRVFELKRDVGIDAPRVTADGKPVTQGVGREQMWRSMRVLKEFDCRELALAASTAAHQVNIQETKNYVKFVARAGYLQLVKASHSNQPARYRFIRSRDTGPRAPLVTGDRNVFDGNTGEEIRL